MPDAPQQPLDYEHPRPRAGSVAREAASYIVFFAAAIGCAAFAGPVTSGGTKGNIFVFLALCAVVLPILIRMRP